MKLKSYSSIRSEKQIFTLTSKIEYLVDGYFCEPTIICVELWRGRSLSRRYEKKSKIASTYFVKQKMIFVKISYMRVS
jgi:hypothetical protein